MQSEKSVVPVSYTHLDVYKRQAEAYPEGCIEAMQKNFKTIAVPASDIALGLGNPKCMNVVLFEMCIRDR